MYPNKCSEDCAEENAEPGNRTGMVTIIQMSHNIATSAIAESELRMKLASLRPHAEALGLWLDFNPDMSESYTHETL